MIIFDALLMLVVALATSVGLPLYLFFRLLRWWKFRQVRKVVSDEPLTAAELGQDNDFRCAWHQPLTAEEQAEAKRTGATLTHGICPECRAKIEREMEAMR